jgi:hypothetical protein
VLFRLPRRRAPRALPLLVCAVALSTACGSTVATGPGGAVAGGAPAQDGTLVQDPTLSVPGEDGLGDGAPGDDGLGSPAAAGDAAVLGGGGGSAGGVSGGSTGSSGGGTAGPPGSPQTGGPVGSGGAPRTSSAFPAKGRGYDEKTMLIGLGVTRSASESGEAIGVQANTGVQEKQAQAVVDDINARGGIFGRKLKLVVHKMGKDEFNSNRAGAQQAACARWTQDTQVFAAVSASGDFQYGDSPLYECLAKKDTPLLFADNIPRERKLYDRYPSHLYTPGVATLDRYGPALARALQEQKYFTGWNTSAGAPGSAPVKVGVLYSSDEPGLPAIYKRALAAVGQNDPQFYELNAKTTQDYSSAVSAAVLRFAADGVTHVLTNGSLTFFGPAANSQGYRPRLGVSSYDGLTLAIQTNRPESLRGALGAGFLPHIDVEQANAPKDVSPQEVRCRKIMEKAGQPASARQTMYSMLTICEDFWLIEEALKRGGAPTSAAMRIGVDSMSQPTVGGVSFAMRYGPRQHDGAHAVRNLAYVDGGFRFTSGNRPLG